MSAPRNAVRLLAASALVGAAIVLPAPGATALVDDFDYSSWHSRYEIGLDDEGRATATVTEHLVAAFPEDVPQNKGIVRGLETRYEGAPLGVDVVSVTDEHGEPVAYETETEDDVLYVLTGDDSYVYGENHYVITYTMRDVMLTAEDTGGDEFYWDLLPLQSTQDIEDFRAEIVLDDALAEKLTGDVSCYEGPEGHTERCDVAGPRATAGGTEFSVSSGFRYAGDGVTVAIGFEPGTVVQAPARRPDALADVGPAAAGIAGLGVATGASFAVAGMRRRSRRATGIVYAQYEVPASLPPLVAAALVPKARDRITAEIVHLAVTGNLMIEYRGRKQPLLHRLDGTPGDPIDEKMLGKIFNKPGKHTAKVPAASKGFAARMRAMETAGVREAHDRGLLTKRRSRWAMALQIASFALIAIGVVLSILSLVQGRGSAMLGVAVLFVTGVVALGASFYTFSTHIVWTPEGAVQCEFLQGVELFIQVAEEDRLRMLQTPEGAETRMMDDVEVLHLYEKLLPYAILFGMLREWGDVIEDRFVDGAPPWMSGYESGMWALTLSSFSHRSETATQYTPSSGGGGSSSSAGSMGGGFSGGGGGGGFPGGR